MCAVIPYAAATMTKHFDLVKEDICRLYRTENWTLNDVRQAMKDRGFHARYVLDIASSLYRHLTIHSTSWYRQKLREWGERKGENSHTDSPTPNHPTPAPADPPNKPLPRRPSRRKPSYDSGYGTDIRDSVSTTGTTGSSPFYGISQTRNSQASSLSGTFANTQLTSIIQNFPRPPSEVHVVDFDSNISSHNTHGNHSSNRNWPQRMASLSYGESTGTSTRASSGLYQSEQKVNAQHDSDISNPPIASTTVGDYASSHAPISRCRLAGNHFFIPHLELGPCQGCGASEAHYVAVTSVSKFLTHDALLDQVQRVKGHLHERDAFLNTPLHFVSSSGPPTMKHIDLFVHSKADLYCTNSDNKNFLHVLDFSRLGYQFPVLLLGVLRQAPALLRARTYDGKTVLHCLLSREITVDLLKAILPIFDKAKNNINSRDSQGLTALEIFCSNWLSHQRSADERKALQDVIDDHAPNVKLLSLGDESEQITPVTLPIPSKSSDIGNILAGKSPNGRFSGDLTSAAQELRHHEMRSIIMESVFNPFAHDFRGRNALHCFGHTLPISPNGGHVYDAHRQHLMEILSRGVDAKDYDRLGSTPLHTLLSACYSGRDDDFRASLIKNMLRRGSDVRDVHMRDRNGEIPLHIACKAGLVACVSVLLRHKSNVHALNNAGRSVIFEAKQAKTMKMHSNAEEAARIQECIDLVKKAHGLEFPIPLEDLAFNDYPQPFWT